MGCLITGWSLYWPLALCTYHLSILSTERRGTAMYYHTARFFNSTLFQPILPFWHLRIPKNLSKRFSFEIVSYYQFPSPLCVVHKSEKAPGLTLVDIKFPLFFRNDSKFFSLSREVIRLKLEYNLYQLSPQETHCEDSKNQKLGHQLSSVRKFSGNLILTFQRSLLQIIVKT